MIRCTKGQSIFLGSLKNKHTQQQAIAPHYCCVMKKVELRWQNHILYTNICTFLSKKIQIFFKKNNGEARVTQNSMWIRP